MPNPAHLDKLCEGPKAWNAWREDNPHVVPDLTEIKLTLNQRQLGPATGGPIDLHSADLEHASLPYATLTRADLEGARLVGVDLTHARLDGANLAGADLTEAILDQADMTGAKLDQAVLFGADLSNTRNLTISQLEAAFGDASTRLPGNLMPPDSWLPSADYHDDDDDYSGWGMPANEPVQQSLYEVLDLTERAGTDEIRSSYRNLVKKLHPDLNPNDEEAQERFKRVTTAYRILNDPAQRQRYDRGEIDGEGRVNPEFEARRRFRRTAFRYYSAAAASFMLAVVALGAVWYTVLSVDPADETPQVAVVSQPKRSERLGGETSPQPTSPTREERSASLSEESARQEQETPPAASPTPEAAAPSATVEPKAPEAPAPESQAALAEQPAEPESADLPISPAPTPADETARAPEARSPEPEKTAAEPAMQNPAPEPASGGGQPDNVGKQATVEPEKAPPPNAAGSGTPGAPQAGNTARPLPLPHKSETGPTASSAPERFSVAAIPQSRPSVKNPTGAAAEAFTVSGEGLPQGAQRWSVPGTASRLLSIRAIEQTLRKESRPFTASDAPGLPERRRGISADLPTHSIPAKPARPVALPQRATPGQSQQARQPQQPNRMASKPQNAARKTSAGEGAPRQTRQQQQQQAVSDILAGGF